MIGESVLAFLPGDSVVGLTTDFLRDSFSRDLRLPVNSGKQSPSDISSPFLNFISLAQRTEYEPVVVKNKDANVASTSALRFWIRDERTVEVEVKVTDSTGAGDVTGEGSSGEPGGVPEEDREEEAEESISKTALTKSSVSTPCKTSIVGATVGRVPERRDPFSTLIVIPLASATFAAAFGKREGSTGGGCSPALLTGALGGPKRRM